jgi:hypothetical protein
LVLLIQASLNNLDECFLHCILSDFVATADALREALECALEQIILKGADQKIKAAVLS